MEIRQTRHGAHVVVITIDNQPRLNAMTRDMRAVPGEADLHQRGSMTTTTLPWALRSVSRWIASTLRSSGRR